MTSTSSPQPVRGPWSDQFFAATQKYTSTALPGFITGAAILSLFPSSLRNPAFRPRPWAICLFAPTMIFSGVMTSQGAKVDGAGTMGAWATIYALVERKGLRSPAAGWRGRAVYGLVVVDAVMGLGAWVSGERSAEEGWVGDI